MFGHRVQDCDPTATLPNILSLRITQTLEDPIFLMNFISGLGGIEGRDFIGGVGNNRMFIKRIFHEFHVKRIFPPNFVRNKGYCARN